MDSAIIEKVEVIPLKMPLPRVFKGSHYFMDSRCTIVTRLHTSAGIVGECYNGDTLEEQGAIVKLLREEVIPLVIGQDASRPENCWEAMLNPTYNILGDRKLAMQAIACVDSAIWDVFGKLLNEPLYRIWGGYRDKLRVIAIAGYYEEGKTLDDYGTEMQELQSLGFGGCKFKVGGRSPEEDAKRVHAAREAVGDDFKLAVDANQGWSLWDAVKFGRLVADLDLMWFEEPCRWFNDKRDMAEVRRMTAIPVAAGQSEFTGSMARELMIDGAVDYLNFDASWSGGATEWRRIAAVAKSLGVTVGHHEEPQISAHLLASLPNGGLLETFHPERDPMFYEIIKDRNAFVDGFYDVPQGPGWGLTLDEGFIDKYRVE
jgi:D-arabinonate dehydratase